MSNTLSVPTTLLDIDPVLFYETRMLGRRLPYHWTGALEARFLDVLTETGSVWVASRAAGMSAKSAYARREKSPDFARRWALALGHARDVMIDVIMEASLDGVKCRPVRSARNGRLGWRVVDPRLGRGRGLRQLDRIEAALGKAEEKAVSSLPFPENRHFLNGRNRLDLA